MYYGVLCCIVFPYSIYLFQYCFVLCYFVCVEEGSLICFVFFQFFNYILFCFLLLFLVFYLKKNGHYAFYIALFISCVVLIIFCFVLHCIILSSFVLFYLYYFFVFCCFCVLLCLCVVVFVFCFCFLCVILFVCDFL